MNGGRGWFPRNYLTVIEPTVGDIVLFALEGHGRRQGRMKRGALPKIPRSSAGSTITQKAKDNKERVKYTISTNGTACEKPRHRMLFIALEGGLKYTKSRKSHQ
jgi:hypothetical protein